jgi:hypothetical protein
MEMGVHCEALGAAGWSWCLVPLVWYTHNKQVLLSMCSWAINFRPQ